MKVRIAGTCVPFKDSDRHLVPYMHVATSAYKVYGIEQAVDLSHNTKPIMYLFNQPWCGACKRLKETFQQEAEKIAKLSEKFILVNVGGDDNNAFGVRIVPVLQQ